MREKWLPIKGFETLYEVSNMGNIRNKIDLKLKKQSGGTGTNSRYRYVTLYKNNVGTKMSVHRLVATAFVKNKHGLPYVLHIENNRENNRADNLKWGNQYQNHKDAVRHGTYSPPPVLKGRSNPRSILNERHVLKIRELRDKDKRKYTQEKLAKMFNVGRGAVRGILEGKSWRHL